eukprot:TRINITY_DN87811_c0_g1_i1.p1 TRINITY_DN87811_c0_g1~~TRINITY_DN87811_c0_g1_i1.p1  ORF type:complete len:425 (+),score=70.87 TRINITY_DN87811_c0_g1_i1:100-1374(+)
MSRQFETVRILGRGSYGTAVLVRAPGACSGALNVVKEVDLVRAKDKCREEALKEAELLKSLVHPNIIGYKDAFLDEQMLCIVMEFADGGDLSAAIMRRRSSGRRYHERDAVAIFGQVVLALEYVHSRRVLHRDLKSQNVFLTRTGEVKLGDFGIARVLEDCEHSAKTRIGTPHIFAPEMCENKPYGFKADVWGLGVMMYELLALEVPFSANNLAGLVIRICTTEPKPIAANYSAELRTLVCSSLAKNPQDRPTAAEIAALPHIQRGLAARRPMTPQTPPPSSSHSEKHCAAAGKPTLLPDIVRVPRPMCSLVRTQVPDEDAELESPKRMRLSRTFEQLSPTIRHGFGTSPSVTQTPFRDGCVTNDELNEAQRILDVDWSPLAPGPARASGRDELSSQGDPIEMSATCSALLCELEQELQEANCS